MKKTLREDNFSQISQILTTVLKNPSQSPLNLESYEDFDQNFLDIPIDLTFLSTLQELYLPDPRYLGKTQLNMTYNMRAILMDWMMEVCNDYMLKRQTFHMALNYVDRFLSLSENLPKSKYQLLGVVSLYIAAKLEEIYPPKLEDFALVGHDYPIEEIKGFEQLVLRRLNFRLHPCGVVFWADWLMFQWDMLIEEKAGVPEALFMDLELLQFKQTNESSYKLFRELYQLMDCAILDYNWVKIEGKMFVLGFITLLLWSYMMKIELKGVRERYMEIFIEDQGGVKKMIEEFLKRANNCRLEDFGKGLGFCAGFFGLEMEYDYPMATKINRENVLEVFILVFLLYIKEILWFLGTLWGILSLSNT